MRAFTVASEMGRGEMSMVVAADFAIIAYSSCESLRSLCVQKKITQRQNGASRPIRQEGARAPAS